MSRKEVWLPVENFSGYEVSTLGRVRSLDREIQVGKTFRTLRGKILSEFVCARGFKNVSLSHKGKIWTFRLHRLIADTFLPKIEGKRHVLHKDGDRGNNRVSNLRRVRFVGSDYYIV